MLEGADKWGGWSERVSRCCDWADTNNSSITGTKQLFIRFTQDDFALVDLQAIPTCQQQQFSRHIIIWKRQKITCFCNFFWIFLLILVSFVTKLKSELEISQNRFQKMPKNELVFCEAASKRNDGYPQQVLNGGVQLFALPFGCSRRT